MKRMLINATHEEELRVAIVDGQKLIDLDIEHKQREQKKSNIYKAKITRVEPSLEAAFVDYGAERHGFLPFKEIAKEYLTRKNGDEVSRSQIKEVLKEGTELVVQVEKEERSNKGAALTTYISLAGRFLVLMPNNARAGGISRRIEGSDRNELRDAISGVNLPEGTGMIARTAAIGRTSEELQWDLDYQADIWKAIKQASEEGKAPFLIYQESNIIVRGLRDYFRGDIGEIIADEQATFDQAAEFIRMYMPKNERKLKLYTDDVPLFNRYQIESQIESAFTREVRLPSGGALVIDHTEALISIDINSARATKGSDIEETATNTNLEAAEEVARQLRIRDLGGLVVIDFIDMLANKNQRAVENRLRDSLKHDRARVQVGKISRFGLLEMSRQRLRPSLGEGTDNVCPRCHGAGTIRTVESAALSILRLLEEDAMKDNTARVVADVPVEVATYLLNEKRQNLTEIEGRCDVSMLIVANPTLDTPNYNIERVRQNDDEHNSGSMKSFELATDNSEKYSPSKPTDITTETPAVSTVQPNAPAPQPVQPRRLAGIAAERGNTETGRGLRGIIGKVTSLFNPGAEVQAEQETEEQKPARSNQRNARRDQNNSQRRTRGGRGRNKNNNNNRQRGNQRDTEASGDEKPATNTRGGGGRGRGANAKNAANKSQGNNANANNSNNSENKASQSQSAGNAAENDGQRKPRRSRGGRGRGGRGRNNENRAANDAQETVSANDDNINGAAEPSTNSDRPRTNGVAPRSAISDESRAATAAANAKVDSTDSDKNNADEKARDDNNEPRRRRGPGRRRQRVDSKKETGNGSSKEASTSDTGAKDSAPSESKPAAESTPASNGRSQSQKSDTAANGSATSASVKPDTTKSDVSDAPKAEPKAKDASTSASSSASSSASAPTSAPMKSDSTAAKSKTDTSVPKAKAESESAPAPATKPQSKSTTETKTESRASDAAPAKAESAKSDTPKAAASNGTAAKPKVSPRQPSQLKSSVRSLASNSEANESSDAKPAAAKPRRGFASKKLPDIAPETKTNAGAKSNSDETSG